MAKFEIKYDAPKTQAEEEKSFSCESDALRFGEQIIAEGATNVHLCGADGCSIRWLDKPKGE
jgi:hypothetical protein